jgi:threonine 3-dehydrogenase
MENIMTTDTMKAVVKEKPTEGKEWKKGLNLIDRKIPSIEHSDEVKLQVMATAICGTDVGIYNSKQSVHDEMIKAKTSPVTIGHEFCGKIVDAGDDARVHLSRILQDKSHSDKEIGNFVKNRNVNEIAKDRDLIDILNKKFYASAEMHVTCGTCYQCRSNQRHVCRNTIINGVHDNGSFAKYVKVPAFNILLFEEGEIPIEIIAFMDALGNAVHTAQSVNIMAQNVAILGLGVQGMMITSIARAGGAAKIFVTDASFPNGPTPEKVENKKFAMARNFGADFCYDLGIEGNRENFIKKVMAETDGTGVDVVFEMSGSYKAYKDAFEIVRMGGTVSLLGLPSGEMSVDFAKDIIFKGITIHGIIGRRVFETWETMKSLLKSGLSEKLISAGFITHQFPLEDFEKGFKAIKDGDALKVLLKP